MFLFLFLFDDSPTNDEICDNDLVESQVNHNLPIDTSDDEFCYDTIGESQTMENISINYPKLYFDDVGDDVTKKTVNESQSPISINDKHDTSDDSNMKTNIENDVLDAIIVEDKNEPSIKKKVSDLSSEQKSTDSTPPMPKRKRSKFLAIKIPLCPCCNAEYDMENFSNSAPIMSPACSIPYVKIVFFCPSKRTA